jgi:MFS family permease
MAGVIRNRNFSKLWTAQILSQTAQQIVNFALVLQVAALTGSGTATSGIIIAFTVPAILFAAIAGVFVERNSKKLMLVFTNIARGFMALAFMLPNESWGVGANLLLIYIVTFLFSSVSQLFAPAEASAIPIVVKRDELVQANSLFNLTLSATQLGGFVVLGPLLLNTIFHHNYAGLYFVISILCFAAAGFTAMLPPDQQSAAKRREQGELVTPKTVAAGTTEIARSGLQVAWDELTEGWRFIRQDPVIMSAILYWSIAIAVFMMLGSIGPLFLKISLGIDESKLFYILLPGGAGLVAGVILVGRIASPQNRESMINFNLLFAGVTLLVFALVNTVLNAVFGLLHMGSTPEWLILGALGLLTMLLGGFNSFISVPAQTALQERAPEQLRARVFSAFYTVSNAILVLPVLLAGGLADAIGYPQTVAAIGVVVMLVAWAGLVRSRTRRNGTHTGTGKDTAPIGKGHVTREEAEAALTVASPAPRPLAASEEQERVKSKPE